MKQKEYFGFGSINNLNSILDTEKIRNVFIVAGKNSFSLSGARKKIEKIFSECRCNYNLFSGFSSNPKIEEINHGFKLFKYQKCEGIIGIGGGSAIDTAKAIKLACFIEYNKKLPLIAIPTTAGSGSEATHFIVYYKGKEKQSKGDLDLTLPEYSICDPALTLSLPKYVRATTGIDALSQAIESYWSVNSTEKSKIFSKESIPLLFKNLEKSVNTEDKISKENLMRASNLAGKAINISQTTACHSISYPITSYFGIAHGHAAALTLGEFLVYNSRVSEADCSDKRGPGYVKKTINELVNLIGIDEVDKASLFIEELMKRIGLKTRLSELGIQKQNINLIIKHGFNPERVKNNPRILTKENLTKILNNIY